MQNSSLANQACPDGMDSIILNERPHHTLVFMNATLFAVYNILESTFQKTPTTFADQKEGGVWKFIHKLHGDYFYRIHKESGSVIIYQTDKGTPLTLLGLLDSLLSAIVVLQMTFQTHKRPNN